MKKLTVIIGLVLVMCLLVPLSCAPPAPPPPPPKPAPGPSPAPRHVEFIEMNATTDKGTYLPSEEVVIDFSFKNITAEPFEVAPFPPDIKIVGHGPYDELVRLFPAGTEAKSLEPGEAANYIVTWDQHDDLGQQVDYGYYWFRIPGGGTLVDKASLDGVFILPPEGVMEKTIEVNKSQTVNGITFILERVELFARGPRFYALNVPPDYSFPPTSPDLPLPPMAHAEYSLDSGPAKEARSAGIISPREKGIEYVWYMSVPVPNGTKELTFTIAGFGDLEGSWEFQMSLE